MRLLCNENVPRALVLELRRRGHDVAWVAEAAPGAPDTAVLDRAAAEQRLCVTFDKDLGELAARTPAAARHGVLLLRVAGHPPSHAAQRIADVIGSRNDWAGHFAVLEPGRLRLRRIGDDPAASTETP